MGREGWHASMGGLGGMLAWGVGGVLVWVTQLLWLEMALFSKKSIMEYRKTFITQPKHKVFC